MIKVLMIGPDRSVHGGISGVVNNYYEAGLQHKIDLCYIGTMVEGSKPTKLMKAITAWFRFLSKLPKYDIVHVNMASDASYYRKSVFIRTAHLFRKKIVIHQHGGDFEKFYADLDKKGQKSVKKVLSMEDAFLVLAEAWKRLFGEIIGEENITVFPDSIRIPARQDKRYGVRRILFLGRLCKEKGIDELLTVMPELYKKYPDAHLYLGGIWEDKKLREKALSLTQCVTDLGWISGEEKEKYLQECDIFVLPSYFEGQSVAILEAMAYSCGIVASYTGGIPDMITENETGLFARPHDAAALQESLDKLLSDSDLCKRLGENARGKVEAEFSIEDNMKRLLGIYESLMMKKG
ncbi:MAG: glycosyltransferase family 4 protein [Bacillus sp. (in: Bacteria)]|nr:glycosyltransferase family 4 protein [Bacillus sp. (in: firmicutes)]MCM1425480.1 glycosyltransferase family 4 protein [Eubacterium sp.]